MLRAIVPHPTHDLAGVCPRLFAVGKNRQGEKCHADDRGRVLCGAVRYRSDAEPVRQAACHCETCRKNSGSAFSMNVAVPQDTLHPRAAVRAATRIIAARAARRSTGSSVATAAPTSSATARHTAPSRSLRPARSITRLARAEPAYLVRRSTALGRYSRERHPSTREPELRRTAIRPHRSSETLQRPFIVVLDARA